MQNIFFFHRGRHFNFLNLVGLQVPADPEMLKLMITKFCGLGG